MDLAQRLAEIRLYAIQSSQRAQVARQSIVGMSPVLHG